MCIVDGLLPLQTTLYEHCVQPLLGSCLRGYNATVFAYGQTGSGKSYTIGSEGCGSEGCGSGGEWWGGGAGFIPRALEELFRHVQVRDCSEGAWEGGLINFT